jgi:hypothetical protein
MVMIVMGYQTFFPFEFTDKLIIALMLCWQCGQERRSFSYIVPSHED